jgi:hypothetical protein
MNTDIQSSIRKVQEALSKAQSELQTIAAPVVVAPLPPEIKQVQIVPEILLSKGYRKSHGLTGADHPVQPHFMVLAKEVSISPGLEAMSVPVTIQQWELATRGLGPAETSLFGDLDKDGLTLWEEWALASPSNTLFCGWKTSTRKTTLQHYENLDSGISHTVEVGDGKQSWRPAVEGKDYKAADLTGTGLTKLEYNVHGVKARVRVLENLNAADGPLAFLRIRLAQSF